MKLSRQSEPESASFEGRTSEEAVERARQALGHDVAVRCWRTRRGGFFGFFTREVFLAGVNIPAGASESATTKRTKRLGRDAKADVSEPLEQSSPLESQSPAESDDAGRTSLDRLVAAMSDEVTLGSDLFAQSSFRDVLEEAQAALRGSDLITRRDTADFIELPDVDEETVSPETSRFAEAVDTSETIEASASEEIAEVEGIAPALEKAETLESAETVESEVTSALQADDPALLSGLRDTLADFGVPIEYRPIEGDDSLNGLVRSFSKLPCAEPLPYFEGAVIVVVGSRRDANAAGLSVLHELGLEATDLIEAQRTSAGRQRVVRRRSANKITVVVVEASMRARGLGEAAEWIENLEPDYVLGAVAATTKHADVAYWRSQLGRMDALAVSRLADTATPGDLMGNLPILFIDGEVTSTLRWVLLVLTLMIERAS